ncbi:HAD hydrolase-like protein [Kurthia huakuii]|uniref:HAD hydrolase-like protein n=1 Tax=Kurthia huakuii TaxID=1421019 RepID=UPI000495AAD8|nr:HAD hydrolase-like protein [Kurthia huakuii]MBM7700624.1 adenosylhomocysteine nucleosidase [Kurthia huakuii]
MKHAIFFDMDGTLFQTNTILAPALEATFTHLRSEGLWKGDTPLQLYRDIMGVPLPVVWEKLCPMHSLETREASNTFFQQALINEIQRGTGTLYDGVEEALVLLSKKWPLYIASNGQTSYLNAIVDHFALDRFIEKVYSIDCVRSGNKSELIAIALKEQRITSGFVVGDRASDINAASDNGLISIGVRFDFAQEHELEKAHYIVSHFDKIMSIILK